MIEDWDHISKLLEHASSHPWTIKSEGEDIYVVNSRGEDITGLAPRAEAEKDFQFIVESRNHMPSILATLEKYFQLLSQHRICIDCGIRMNRQMYCVKCDTQWEFD